MLWWIIGGLACFFLVVERKCCAQPKHEDQKEVDLTTEELAFVDYIMEERKRR